MSFDDGDVTAVHPVIGPFNEVERRLGQLESRRFRGDRWLPADEAVAVCIYADGLINQLYGEIERQKRQVRELADQVAMLRHGVLPSTAAQGPDPMVLELTMRAQDEASRTIGEASAEGAEIIAEARNQAAEILVEARNQAAEFSGGAQRGAIEVNGYSESMVSELRQRIRALEERHADLVTAASVAEQNLRQWQRRLSAQADQLHHDAAAAGVASEQLQTIISGQRDAS